MDMFSLPFPAASFCSFRNPAHSRPTTIISNNITHSSSLAATHGCAGETEQLQPPSEIPKENGDPAVSLMTATSFDRRALLGFVTALGVGLGGNLGGVTSLLLGLNSGFSQSLKLDVVYPINGFKRCLEKDFEFLYPATWVGDQRLLYRAAERAEKERLYGDLGKKKIGKASLIEPVVAFGPAGSSGELNVSVISAPVPIDFRLDKLGDPKEAGEMILDRFIKNAKVTPTLLHAEKREDNLNGEQLLYYNLEFLVQGPSFLRRNVSVYVAYNSHLFSMNAQTPEVSWAEVRKHFFEMANSFRVRH